ncbi:MAG: hypothetical protein ACYTF1_05040 [Planctomycetota bacterium]|jgi:hypothetical protein
MKSDPAIEAIRKTRHEISERFGHDTKALIDHYKKMQENYADRLVSEPPAVHTPSDSGQGPTKPSTGGR